MCNYDEGCRGSLTPIYDFINSYRKKQPVRFHMPGHKGKSFLGFEEFDITEISGADSLYEAEGIIAESEKNASLLFGSSATFYSTEGSSQCIKAILYLLLSSSDRQKGKRPYIIATRNAHKAFFHGAALLDLDVVWWQPEKREALCSIKLNISDLEQLLKEREEKPIGVYITSPDYLGNVLPIRDIADLCHKYETKLAVDNAHGAYLHFLDKPLHPLDLGADLCCDSAHKTLPVLTGGAYLHLGKNTKQTLQKEARQALAIFGSTSPSYLTLLSLDYCNRYLTFDYHEKLKLCIERIRILKEDLLEAGWKVEDTEPLKLTLRINYLQEQEKRNGPWLAEKLETEGIYAEYADPDFLVLMFTPENGEEEFLSLEKILFTISAEKAAWKTESRQPVWKEEKRVQIISFREALLSQSEAISVESAEGRICANPMISCPPAIPIVVGGERITGEDIKLLQYYGIEQISVIRND